MNHQMLAGMAEATRLTRGGKLNEATALIQRMLHGTSTPTTTGSSSDGDTDEPIEGSFQVMDSAAQPTPPVTHGPIRATNTDRHGASPKSDRSVPAGTSERASVEVLNVPPVPPADQPDTIHKTHRFRHGRTHIDTMRIPEQVSRFMSNAGRQSDQTDGQFVTGSYTNQAGSRTYKLYIPSSYQGQAVPLVVMLHGCTQTPDDFAASTQMNVLAEQEGFLVVYPAQTSAANQSRCWNWFQMRDQHRDQGEPSLIAGITRQICSTYQVDPRRVYVAGLSAGGAMAMIMGVTYPDLYAAIGIHSGLAYGAAHDLPSAFAAMQNGQGASTGKEGIPVPSTSANRRLVPMIVFHGDRDTTVHPRNGDQVCAQWAMLRAREQDSVVGMKLHVSVRQGQIPAGHAYTCSSYHDTSGQVVFEQWLVHGAGHAWSGGSPSGSFADPKGPDATAEMVRFFREHQQDTLSPADH